MGGIKPVWGHSSSVRIDFLVVASIEVFIRNLEKPVRLVNFTDETSDCSRAPYAVGIPHIDLLPHLKVL